MNKVGFMQGRLSDLENNKIQSFPWKNWEKEFSLAFKINIGLMEWTLDYPNLKKNPLMTEEGRQKINSLSSKYDLEILSLTGDCFMQKPFWKVNDSDQTKLIETLINVIESSGKVNIGMVLIPLVDNGSIENQSQEDRFIEICLDQVDLLRQHNVRLIFESDYPPDKLAKFIDNFPHDTYGINYDTGNSASLGFNVKDEFKEYGERILNLHIKDRSYNGPSVPLGEGATDFDLVFSLLRDNMYKGNFILQTARSEKRLHVEIIQLYKEMVLDWLKDNE
tara:strand:- start:1763 stop:2596 length:834 start_codon:yes stop_codon:yes gene_type:complete